MEALLLSPHGPRAAAVGKTGRRVSMKVSDAPAAKAGTLYRAGENHQGQIGNTMYLAPI